MRGQQKEGHQILAKSAEPGGIAAGKAECYKQNRNSISEPLPDCLEADVWKPMFRSPASRRRFETSHNRSVRMALPFEYY
jgi:hypothetical protein